MKRCIIHDWSPPCELGDKASQYFKQCNKCGRIKITTQR